MFDTLHVHESLIHPLIDQHGFELEMSKYKDYFHFQTKDLDNFLTNFYIEADGSFCWEKLNQEYVPSTEEGRKKGRWNFGEMKEISPPEKIEDTRTSYIEFYDSFNLQDERIFITFLGHVKNGKLIESISIQSIERTDLKKEAEETKIYQQKWEKVRATWEWRLCEFLRQAKWKISRLFSPLSNWFDNLDKSLRNKAKKKYLDEKDIGDW